MARKHRDVIRQREHEAFVRKSAKADTHEEMLKQHEEWKKSKSNPFSDVQEDLVEVVSEID
jgi:hypothetical protein